MSILIQVQALCHRRLHKVRSHDAIVMQPSSLLLPMCGGRLYTTAALLIAFGLHSQGMLPMASRVRNWTVFILGMVCMVTGTYSSIGSIMAASA